MTYHTHLSQKGPFQDHPQINIIEIPENTHKKYKSVVMDLINQLNWEFCVKNESSEKKKKNGSSGKVWIGKGRKKLILE